MDGTLIHTSRDCLFAQHVTALALALSVICWLEAFHAANDVDRGV
jgi:hypothetical protein